MDKSKYFLDLSKCRNGEQQTKAISLLPKQKYSNQYQITNRHTILSLDEKNNEWWVFGTRSLHKKELTYPEFIKLFEGGEGETTFKNYIQNQRDAFVRFTSENYTVDKHLQLRTEIDSLLIAYDQMQNKLNSNQ